MVEAAELTLVPLALGSGGSGHRILHRYNELESRVHVFTLAFTQRTLEINFRAYIGARAFRRSAWANLLLVLITGLCALTEYFYAFYPLPEAMRSIGCIRGVTMAIALAAFFKKPPSTETSNCAVETRMLLVYLHHAIMLTCVDAVNVYYHNDESYPSIAWQARDAWVSYSGSSYATVLSWWSAGLHSIHICLALVSGYRFPLLATCCLLELVIALLPLCLLDWVALSKWDGRPTILLCQVIFGAVVVAHRREITERIEFASLINVSADKRMREELLAQMLPQKIRELLQGGTGSPGYASGSPDGQQPATPGHDDKPDTTLASAGRKMDASASPQSARRGSLIRHSDPGSQKGNASAADERGWLGRLFFHRTQRVETWGRRSSNVVVPWPPAEATSVSAGQAQSDPLRAGAAGAAAQESTHNSSSDTLAPGQPSDGISHVSMKGQGIDSGRGGSRFRSVSWRTEPRKRANAEAGNLRSVKSALCPGTGAATESFAQTISQSGWNDISGASHADIKPSGKAARGARAIEFDRKGRGPLARRQSISDAAPAAGGATQHSALPNKILGSAPLGREQANDFSRAAAAADLRAITGPSSAGAGPIRVLARHSVASNQSRVRASQHGSEGAEDRRFSRVSIASMVSTDGDTPIAVATPHAIYSISAFVERAAAAGSLPGAAAATPRSLTVSKRRKSFDAGNTHGGGIIVGGGGGGNKPASWFTSLRRGSITNACTSPRAYSVGRASLSPPGAALSSHHAASRRSLPPTFSFDRRRGSAGESSIFSGGSTSPKNSSLSPHYLTPSVPGVALASPPVVSPASQLGFQNVPYVANVRVSEAEYRFRSGELSSGHSSGRFSQHLSPAGGPPPLAGQGGDFTNPARTDTDHSAVAMNVGRVGSMHNVGGGVIGRARSPSVVSNSSWLSRLSAPFKPRRGSLSVSGSVPGTGATEERNGIVADRDVEHRAGRQRSGTTAAHSEEGSSRSGGITYNLAVAGAEDDEGVDERSRTATSGKLSSADNASVSGLQLDGMPEIDEAEASGGSDDDAEVYSGDPVAFYHPFVTVVFIGIANLNSISNRTAPRQLVGFLDRFYGLCDDAASTHGVYKVMVRTRRMRKWFG